MRRNGIALLATERSVAKPTVRKMKEVTPGLGFQCKWGQHSICSKNKCTCFCHDVERKAMINP